ncbi:MAG TPA: hypothetical protein VHE32_13570 [Rhodanobacteraceae bacterium]|nr:hypothetical protein [Rhodanobacteraceae bacterium]
MKSLKFCIVAGAFLLALSAPVGARTLVGVSVGVPPPRVVRVVVRPAYAEIPGYWRWNGVRRVWIAGYRVAARPGYRYVPARWRARPGWRLRAGYRVR